MPNAMCFLVAYAIVFGLELTRWARLSANAKIWLMRSVVAATAVALLTHSIYLIDRIFLSAFNSNTLRLVSSWHDWGMLTAWALAVAYTWLLLKRRESWIGLFVLPLLLVLIAGSLIVTKAPLGNASTATLWRVVHGVAMTIGTMFVTLGCSIAVMHLIQARRLKLKRPMQGLLRLPSLEYLQTFGSFCLLMSAGAIGFGVISGIVMNLVRDGQVNWSDRGILFSSGLFVWLTIASSVQWFYARQGKGHFTAWMNIWSFVIVGIAIALVMSAPHGGAL
jgi:hypothetical protein